MNAEHGGDSIYAFLVDVCFKVHGNMMYETYNECKPEPNKSFVADVTQEKNNMYMDYKRESGRRIRLARIEAGFERVLDLAQAIGVKQERLSMYERGHRYVDPAIAVKIARQTGRKPGWIMAVEDDPGLSQREHALLNRWRATDDRGRDQIWIAAQAQPEPKGPAN